MKNKLFIVLGILVVFSMVLSACTSTATETPGYPAAGDTTSPTAYPAAAPQKIRVATDATWPPFEIVDEATKEIVGYDIDLFNAIAEKANLEVEFINTPFDSVLSGMATCQFDAAISAMTIDEDRKKSFDFSDPYISAGQIAVVQFADTTTLSKDDLAGKVIGAQLGTTGEKEANKITGATVKPYDTVDLAFLDLANGQIDAVFADYPTALPFVAKSPDKIKAIGEVFTDESYGIAVCKGNTELVEKLNAALKQLVEEGKLVELEKKWLAVQ